MGGRLDTGLGQALLAKRFDVTGRELVGEFRKLAFSKQVEAVATDLQGSFWSPDARVIANSFGAYLFLHAQAQLPPSSVRAPARESNKRDFKVQRPVMESNFELFQFECWL